MWPRSLTFDIFLFLWKVLLYRLHSHPLARYHAAVWLQPWGVKSGPRRQLDELMNLLERLQQSPPISIAHASNHDRHFFFFTPPPTPPSPLRLIHTFNCFNRMMCHMPPLHVGWSCCCRGGMKNHNLTINDCGSNICLLPPQPPMMGTYVQLHVVAHHHHYGSVFCQSALWWWKNSLSNQNIYWTQKD